MIASTLSAAAVAPRRRASVLSRALARILEIEEQRRQRARLARLDARLLRDIGLTAADIDAAFRR